MEAPLLWRMLNGEDCNEAFLASRETAELRAETLQMGRSLALLLRDLELTGMERQECSFPMAFAQAVKCLEIDARDALVAYLWSWLENQVMAALKAVPLGQTDGQRMLLALGGTLERVAFKAMNSEPVNLAPGLAFLSARHETQYSRLFRS
jgi:urease accessory protein